MTRKRETKIRDSRFKSTVSTAFRYCSKSRERVLRFNRVQLSLQWLIAQTSTSCSPGSYDVTIYVSSWPEVSTGDRSMQALLSSLCVRVRRTLLWLSPSILALSLPAQPGPRATPSLPTIDMHFHTMWDGPNVKEALTGFVSPQTPEEMRRLNLAALSRYHIVKVVASGDQLPSYEQELGPRLLPGILFPTEVFGKPPVSPNTLRQMHKEGNLAALAEFAPQYLGSNRLRHSWNNIGLLPKNSTYLWGFTWG
jgi:hypothetical protein